MSSFQLAGNSICPARFRSPYDGLALTEKSNCFPLFFFLPPPPVASPPPFAPDAASIARPCTPSAKPPTPFPFPFPIPLPLAFAFVVPHPFTAGGGAGLPLKRCSDSSLALGLLRSCLLSSAVVRVGPEDEVGNDGNAALLILGAFCEPTLDDDEGLVGGLTLRTIGPVRAEGDLELLPAPPVDHGVECVPPLPRDPPEPDPREGKEEDEAIAAPEPGTYRPPVFNPDGRLTGWDAAAASTRSHTI
jgi:hypothetical protein